MAKQLAEFWVEMIEFLKAAGFEREFRLEKKGYSLESYVNGPMTVKVSYGTNPKE